MQTTKRSANPKIKKKKKGGRKKEERRRRRKKKEERREENKGKPESLERELKKK